MTSARLSRVIHETVSVIRSAGPLCTQHILRSVFGKTVVGQQEPLIGKAGTKRPGTIRQFLRQLVNTVEYRYPKFSMVVNHHSSLSKAKRDKASSVRGSFRRRITRYAAQCCLYVNERCADTRLPFFKCSHSTVLLPDRTEQLPLYGSQAVGRDRDLIQPVLVASVI